MSHRGRSVLLAIGVAAGIGLAYVDSLPRWDDTGMLVGGMMLASGLLTVAGGRPAWLVALSVGMWIPAREILAGGNPLIAVVLLFALAGAYAGALIRSAIAGTAN